MLSPGTTVRLHPVAFVVITPEGMFGEILSEVTENMMQTVNNNELRPIVIQAEDGRDVVGVVTTLEGEPLESNDMASRIGGYDDIKALELAQSQMDPDSEEAKGFASRVIESLLGSKNARHNNYQDFQAFLDAGGRIGLQHDPLQYGRYIINPYLVKVERVPMLVVRQGEVAVIKAFVGLPTVDTSGEGFKFGSIVAPGHRGIWAEPLRTGKYTLNPRIYAAEIVPTSILTLNWAEATSVAHELDASLSAIRARSSDAFEFAIDLQVQIHVPDTRAPKVISMVGTMLNLVNEVLQSAVGNYFRNSLQQLKAISFIETRDTVQAEAEQYIKDYLIKYEVEVRGVYIQDVVFPEDLTRVLRDREIAAQEKATFVEQQLAQQARIELEKTTGTANAQGELARAQVSIDIERAKAEAVKARVEGEAAVIERTGTAEASAIAARGNATASAAEALGLANAKAYEAQRDAIGAGQTAAVAILHEIGVNGINVMPQVLVNGGAAGGGSPDAIMALVTSGLATNAMSTIAAAPLPTATAAAASTLPAPSAPAASAPEGEQQSYDDGMNN